MPKLLFVHRWIGVVLALIMLGWFASGLVIANSASISMSREQQLGHAGILSPQSNWLTLRQAQSRGHEKGEVDNPARKDATSVAEARLAIRAGEPFWLIETDGGQRKALSAIDGRRQLFSPGDALRIGHDWLAAEGAINGVMYLDTVDTVPGVRSAEALKPFHRVGVNDAKATILIVSAQTGDVVQAAPRLARMINYAGNWLHLFRPLDLIGAEAYRRDALTYAGFLAFVGAFTGLAIGVIKWKPGFFGRPTYARGRTQPYRETWLKYHFWAGLIGGVLALIWAGSGFLSTNPGQIFSPAAPSRDELVRYRGLNSSLPFDDWRPTDVAGLPQDSVELLWSRLDDEAVLVSYGRNGVRARLQSGKTSTSGFTEAFLVGAAKRLNADAAVESVDRMSDYDAYYFVGHGQSNADRPLPILRINFADAGKTTVYLDPEDGRLLLRLDNSRRLYRWLYSAVHHWDFGWFHAYPAARRGWIIAWAGLGLVFAASAVVLAWRRLRRSLPERAPQAQKAVSGAGTT